MMVWTKASREKQKKREAILQFKKKDDRIVFFKNVLHVFKMRSARRWQKGGITQLQAESRVMLIIYN